MPSSVQAGSTPEATTAHGGLAILNVMAPMFKAASIYPGYEAAPTQLAAAVKLMSGVALELATHIASRASKSPVDAAQPQGAVQAFTAQLVASHWISAVIARGGVMRGQLPAIDADQFKPAIDLTMSLSSASAEPGASGALAGECLPATVLATLAPVALEVERYAALIEGFVPGVRISRDALLMELSQWIVQKARQGSDQFGHGTAPVDACQREALLHAMIGHATEAVLASWERCRGEVLGQIKDADTPEEAARHFAASDFRHGFPVQRLLSRAATMLDRLTGAARHACALLCVPAANRV